MKQITILTESQNDIIAQVMEALASEKINISSIAGENYGRQTVINVTVYDEPAALLVLQKKHDWQVISEEALLVRIDDEVGALAKLARRLLNNGITLRSIRFVERHKRFALVAIATDEPEMARSLLKDMLAG